MGGGSQEYPPLTAKISGLPSPSQNPGQDTYPPSLKTQVSTYPPLSERIKFFGRVARGKF